MRYRVVISIAEGHDRPRQCFFPDRASANEWVTAILPTYSTLGLKAHVYEIAESKVGEYTLGTGPDGKVTVFDTTPAKGQL